MKLIHLVLALAAPLSAAAPPAGDGDAIIRQELEWSAAFARHDLAALDRILAADYLGTDGRGVISTKADELAEARPPARGEKEPPFVVLGDALSDLKVRLYGQVGVLTSRNDERVRAGGRETVLVYRRTTVWIKREGRWQCVSFHASRLQPGR